MRISFYRYSQISKALQIIVLLFLLLMVASKAYCHLDLIEPSLSVEIERKTERSREVERQKQMDREIEPNISDKERAARDRDLESGRNLGAV